MTKKILSVSIAAYNMEKYLPTCLDSFLEESVLRRCEVFVVNDGSKDGTLDIANDYADRYPDTFVVIDKENGGLGSTFNSSIKQASGKYFKWLDSDDMFITHNLVKLLDEMERQDVDAVITPYICFKDRTGEVIERLDEFFEEPRYIDSICEYQELTKKAFPYMHSVAYKTELLRDIELAEHCFYVDGEYTIKAFQKCRTLFFYPVPVYLYRLARANQSVDIMGVKKHYKEDIVVIKRILDAVKHNSECKRMVELKVDLVFTSFCMLKPTVAHYRELKEFDEYVKRYFDIKTRRISFIRRFGYLGYVLLKFRDDRLRAYLKTHEAILNEDEYQPYVSKQIGVL